MTSSYVLVLRSYVSSRLNFRVPTFENMGVVAIKLNSFYDIAAKVGGTRYLSKGGPCKQFISEPQILSYSFEEP